MTEKKTSKKKTPAKRYGSTYKSSTRKYANTTLYRTTATNRKAPNSAGVRESTMTVKYRSVPNKAPKPKTAKAPAKGKAAKTAKKTDSKKRIVEETRDHAGKYTGMAKDYFLAGAGKRPSRPVALSKMTDWPADQYVKDYLKPWNAGVRARKDEFVRMTMLPEERKKWPTLAGMKAADAKGKLVYAISFDPDDKLQRHEISDFHDRRLRNIDKETEKAVHAQIQIITLGTGAKSLRYVWLPKSAVQIR